MHTKAGNLGRMALRFTRIAIRHDRPFRSTTKLFTPRYLQYVCQSLRVLSSSNGNYSRKNILSLRDERKGFIQDVFPLGSASDIAEWLKSGSRTIYAGFDPTANSLHIGNLLVIMAMLHAQRAGHRVLALVGGATAKIGDPSGKTSERPLLEDEIIAKNVLGITENLERVFNNHSEIVNGERQQQPIVSSDMFPVQILNNDTWYREISLIDFLRTAGRQFRMGKLLSRDSVKTRLATGDTKDGGKPDPDGGLSFTEFSYQLFQAYDWFYLRSHHDCSIQLGGSDQMGNIATGHDFITRHDKFKEKNDTIVSKKSGPSPELKRKTNDLPAYGILLPLVTSESGEKFGKSESGQSRVWLSADKTTAFDFYQFFFRLPDSQIEKMLYFYTLLPPTEIKDLMSLHSRESEKRHPQKKLAEFLTRLVHGTKGLSLAVKTTDILFTKGYSDEDMHKKLSSLSQDEMATIFSQANHQRLLFTQGISVIDLALKLGCFKKEKDAVRIITAGGFYINQTRKTNIDELIMLGIHVLSNHLTLVRVGKKDYYVVEWTL